MMKWRHYENPLAREFETHHLQNHRDGFDHENAAYHNEEQLLLATNRHDTNRAAERERPGIAHENFRWKTIEPEEAQTRTDQCGADDSQFPRKRIERNLQIFGDSEIPSGVRKQSIGKRHRNSATNRQTIQPVGKID